MTIDPSTPSFKLTPALTSIHSEKSFISEDFDRTVESEKERMCETQYPIFYKKFKGQIPRVQKSYPPLKVKRIHY